ncbi:dTMP kinase [Jiangella alba]|uniref:Thymidylate kinase n=1 Tax=Jiangella alba TaxID=561176 RepID=A0A1H5J7Q5_9ACTN|nr:dTMP kinase [Jiangella alba]SEE48555.1 thymidylate kinase [Jiangella alba]
MPSSDPLPGLFVTIDGPSGIGKSTTARTLHALLTQDGHNSHLTCEPSGGPIGTLARELTEQVTGPALACLYAADRYHHLENEIRPAMATGKIVITDRYLLSGLVMQQFDGVDPAFIRGINADIDRPDVAVVLDADPHVITGRLAARGKHNRFQRITASSFLEAHLYRKATEELTAAGYPVLRLDCTQISPEQAADHIRDALAGPIATLSVGTS